MMARVALVTGGSSGIGRSICRVLTEKGVRVYGSSRKAKHGDTLDNFQLVGLDVTDPASIESAIQYIVEKEGTIDILVNNAGIGHAGPIEDASTEGVREIFETNVVGVFSMCKAIMPIMRENRSGYILNVSSLGGLIGLPFRGIYCSSKYAIEGFTETLSQEAKLFGIKVCLVEPGDIKTNINENRKVTNSIASSPYKEHFTYSLKAINAEVEEGYDPEKIGHVVFKIVNTKRPKLRYKVGALNQRLAIKIKRFLPDRLVERLIMKTYKMK
jgi:NAD(P)-dependent dehydrogenase (short-subunit alcohol dehydrogenase family)